MSITALSATEHGPSGADLWNAIVQTAIAVYRRTAFHEVTLQRVADAAGFPLDVVVERFPRNDDLVFAVVQVWNAQRMAALVPIAEREGAVAFLRALLAANESDPSLPRLLTSMVNVAATPGHPMAALLLQQWQRFHELVHRALVRDVLTGRESPGMEPFRAADELIALHEGLQIQRLIRPESDAFDAFDDAVDALRALWAARDGRKLWTV